ncbi:twin-arginine translocase TatA/TatE family subunit [Actinomadura napierensis]|uniref:Sec-independent protein translocase protein TatA n=1 Tax=Actinomadura napierensis TaxID=267854 RepID=A0ABN2YQD9_9ACTN
MGNFGTSEILIVLAVVLVLFGSTRLPNLARSLGRSARILRDETQGLRNDEAAPEDTRGETGEHVAPSTGAAAPRTVSLQGGPAGLRERAALLRAEAARLEHPGQPTTTEAK